MKQAESPKNEVKKQAVDKQSSINRLPEAKAKIQETR